MPNITRRQALVSPGAFLVAAILTHSGEFQAAVAQTTTGASNPTVEHLLREIGTLKEEVRYLRRQDVARRAWEDSVIERLPKVSTHLATESTRLPEQSDGANPSCNVEQEPVCPTKPCGCRCYPCQCPLAEAPCIDCPRVSTLNPYFNVHVFGALKLDMLFSEPRAVSAGTPFLLAPGPVGGLSQNRVSIHARQSTLGAALTGPQFGGFQSGGLLVAMFFNDAVIVDRYGLLPLQAFGELKNDDWRFAAGLQFDVFNPGMPTVLPFSALCGSGNSGNSFRGQIRLERFLKPSQHVQWTLQGALSSPITTTIDPAFRISEDNGWPNVEARIAWGFGQSEMVGLEAKRPLEIGISGVVGQIRTTEPLVAQIVADVWGVGADFRWKFLPFMGVTGEVYSGQTLGSYSGAVLQNINVDTAMPVNSTLEGIRSTGGWLETFVYWTPCLHSHVGFGIDDPLDRDVAVTQRTQNSTFFANAIWDVNPTFRVGFEFAWRETKYRSPLIPDNEGPGFHTQFQWAF
jgi:hypothetical protein